MRNRSGVSHHEDDLVKLTEAELEQEITRVTMRLKITGTTYQKKSFFQRLNWLAAHREAKFGIPAVDSMLADRAMSIAQVAAALRPPIHRGLQPGISSSLRTKPEGAQEWLIPKVA